MVTVAKPVGDLRADYADSLMTRQQGSSSRAILTVRAEGASILPKLAASK